MQDTRPRQKIVITGAAGRLGRLASAALRSDPAYQVLALDFVDAPDVTRVDLHSPAEDWSHHFAGAGIILHLAGEKSIDISEAVARREIEDLTRRILAEAERHSVPKVIYASSCEVLRGLRSSTGLNGRTPVAPLSPYARSKANMEREGRTWARATGLSFLALRIGMVLKTDWPDPRSNLPEWQGGLWLSHQDWQGAVLCACRAPLAGFDCVSITSRNAGDAWDLSHTEATIGFVPQDGYTPTPPFRRIKRRALTRLWRGQGQVEEDAARADDALIDSRNASYN